MTKQMRTFQKTVAFTLAAICLSTVGGFSQAINKLSDSEVLKTENQFFYEGYSDQEYILCDVMTKKEVDYKAKNQEETLESSSAKYIQKGNLVFTCEWDKLVLKNNENKTIRTLIPVADGLSLGRV